MAISSAEVARTLIQRLFVHIEGIKSIVYTAINHFNDTCLLEPVKQRREATVRSLASFFTHILFRPFNLCVTCAPSDPLRDTKSCNLHLFGTADEMPLNGSEVLSMETGLLLRTLMLDKTSFQSTYGQRRVFEQFFDNDAIEKAVDRLCMAEYAAMLILDAARRHSELLYYNTKLVMLAAIGRVSDQRVEEYHLTTVATLDAFVRETIVTHRLGTAVVKLHGYDVVQADGRRKRRALRRDTLHEIWGRHGHAEPSGYMSQDESKT